MFESTSLSTCKNQLQSYLTSVRLRAVQKSRSRTKRKQHMTNVGYHSPLTFYLLTQYYTVPASWSVHQDNTTQAMSPTQTLSAAARSTMDDSRSSIELSSMPIRASTSNTSSNLNNMNRINEDNHVNTHRNHTNAERAMATSSSALHEFPDPLGLRARIFTPSADDDKGS